jgi:hypothetical protein
MEIFTNLKQVDALGTHAFHALAYGSFDGHLRYRRGLEDTPFGGAQDRVGGFERRTELALGRGVSTDHDLGYGIQI